MDQSLAPPLVTKRCNTPGVEASDDGAHGPGGASRRQPGHAAADNQHLHTNAAVRSNWRARGATTGAVTPRLTFAGGTFPAAVIWPVKNRPKLLAASTTALYLRGRAEVRRRGDPRRGVGGGGALIRTPRCWPWS